MAEYDVVIVGGGPAGLTAGLYLVRGKRRVILLEKESYGGNVKNIELIENYPGFSEPISGARLSSEMSLQASKYGLQSEVVEATGIEIYSSSIWVQCTGGKGYTASAVIVAGGSKYKKLGIPGEEQFLKKGVINCALCEGGQFTNKTIVVCGGGDTGVTEALYLANMAAKVILVEVLPRLTATAILRDRASSNPKIEIHTSTKLEAISGKDSVEAVEISHVGDNKKQTLKADGVLVAVGLLPNTSYLEGIVTLDKQGFIMVNSQMESEVSGIFAAGDIRSNSPRQIATAVGDGALAAMSAEKFLRERA